MARFTLYYWPIPFRGQMLRYMLAHSGQDWAEADRTEVTALYHADAADQPVPFVGPPLLHDAHGDLWLAQAPAIALYLARELALLPSAPALQAQSLKLACDSIDVLHALTLNCGQEMWTGDRWAAFTADRLPDWLHVFEETGRRHGLSARSGTLLGTEAPGLADFACAALWATICDRLPALEPTIARHAPRTLALSRRIAETPPIAALRADQRARWGEVWCEGQIEASLRRVLAEAT